MAPKSTVECQDLLQCVLTSIISIHKFRALNGGMGIASGSHPGPRKQLRVAVSLVHTESEAVMRALRTICRAACLASAIAAAAEAAPLTVGGDAFTLVATLTGGTQLFGLVADGTGNLYIGNNSNNTTGIPLQRFDSALFSGVPIALQNFGPAVGDADGMAFSGGSIFVADRDEGIQRISVPGAIASLFRAGTATNPTGSPIVVRPSDGHIFVGRGGLTGDKRIDEYDSTGLFVTSHITATDVETMTFDAASGIIYYAAFGSAVRALNPTTGVDTAVGNSSGTIDGGLTFDPVSGLLFVGTANGVNSGLVETIDIATGITSLFATGFDGSTGILRDPFSGDLYFLGTNTVTAGQFNNVLYRIESNKLPGGTQDVPEPASLALLAIGLAGFALMRRRSPT